MAKRQSPPLSNPVWRGRQHLQHELFLESSTRPGRLLKAGGGFPEDLFSDPMSPAHRSSAAFTPKALPAQSPQQQQQRSPLAVLRNLLPSMPSLPTRLISPLIAGRHGVSPTHPRMVRLPSLGAITSPTSQQTLSPSGSMPDYDSLRPEMHGPGIVVHREGGGGGGLKPRSLQALAAGGPSPEAEPDVGGSDPEDTRLLLWRPEKLAAKRSKSKRKLRLGLSISMELADTSVSPACSLQSQMRAGEELGFSPLLRSDVEGPSEDLLELAPP